MAFKTSQTVAMVHKVLLLGCGDIAQRLAKNLSAKNLPHCVPQRRYDIVGVRRTPQKNMQNICYKSLNARDTAQMQSLLSAHFDVIIMTMTPSENSDEGYRQGYVEPIQTLLTALAAQTVTIQKKTPTLIVFVSSTAVYGQDDGSWVNEHSITEPKRYNGKRLLEAEALLQSSAIDSVCVRFSGIYGPGRNHLIKQVRAQQWRDTDKTQWSNRIHVDDCAGVLAHLIERHQAGKTLEPIYLASDSEPVSRWHIKQWLAAYLGIIEYEEVSDYNGAMQHKRCSNKLLLESGYVFKYPGYRWGYR